MLADRYQPMGAPSIVPKPFVRSVNHDNMQNFDETQDWNLQTPLPPLVFQFFISVADLGTFCALVHLASVLRRRQHQEEEEKIAIGMPKVIWPPFTIFTTTESDKTCLVSRRHDITNLPGSMFFWGSMLSSSTSFNVYSGAWFSVVTVVCRISVPSDTFVPIFLLPTLLAFKDKNRPIIVALILLTTLYYYMVTLPLIKVKIPKFSTPNIGLQWYFNMQVFDCFQPYFGLLFFGLQYVLIRPLAVQFQHLPVELMGCYWFLYMIFHIQPMVTDLLVGLSALVLLFPWSLYRMSTVLLVALLGIPVPLLLYCLDWYMRLETGTSNANFIYFQCLAYHVFCAIIFINFCSATVKRQMALQLMQVQVEKQKIMFNNYNGGWCSFILLKDIVTWFQRSSIVPERVLVDQS